MVEVAIANQIIALHLRSASNVFRISPVTALLFPLMISQPIGLHSPQNQHPAVSRRAAMVRTQGADRCAGYASNSHLIDPAMTPVRVDSRLTHCIPCPDGRPSS